MIYPDSVVRGQSAVHNAVFVDLRNQPIIGTQPATWSLINPHNEIVLTGVGSQPSMAHPERWQATITIPTAAPLTQASERYRLVWTLPAGEQNTFSTSFRVVEEGDVIPFERDLLVRHDTTFIMRAPSQPAKLTIFPPYLGGPPEEHAVPAFTGTNELAQHTIIGGLSANGSIDGAVPYVAVWEWEEGGSTYSEMQMIYVLSLAAATFVNSMRRDLDKAKNKDINPALQLTDIDLLHYGMEGFTRLNSEPPAQTTFTIINCPEPIRHLAKMCGLVEAARAQYLAEGVSGNFDFSGLSVQLNIDRASVWQTYYEMVNAGLEDRIGRVKRQLANSFTAGSSYAGRVGGGALGFSLGATTNALYMYSNAWTRSHLLRYVG